MRVYPFLFLLSGLCFAQSNGFSYWWYSDGLIDYAQMAELDILSEDTELWCALAELYVGKEQAEEAECVFDVKKTRKSTSSWRPKIGFSSGANLDTNGNLQNKTAKASGSIRGFTGEIRFKESEELKGTVAFRHGIFYAKAGDLTNKNRGILSEININDLHLGGQWQKDTAWVYGKFSKNFWEKRIFAGGNFRKNRSRTWQGVRLWGWNFRMTETAVIKNDENLLDFAYLLERKRKGARLAFDFDKKKMGIAAGVKLTDSLWAKAEHPLRLRIGWDKKAQGIRISNSLLYREDKPWEFRSESKIKFFTVRWTMRKMDLKQFYIGFIY
ncbi:MAG: hypothetical protein FWC26_00090 [Fibromonadales bacterium]|nr:hypothetical protein [Fibromonadales bacterium]